MKFSAALAMLLTFCTASEPEPVLIKQGLLLGKREEKFEARRAELIIVYCQIVQNLTKVLCVFCFMV